MPNTDNSANEAINKFRQMMKTMRGEQRAEIAKLMAETLVAALGETTDQERKDETLKLQRFAMDMQLVMFLSSNNGTRDDKFTLLLMNGDRPVMVAKPDVLFRAITKSIGTGGTEVMRAVLDRLEREENEPPLLRLIELGLM